ncbi:HAMP domain-containing sensor histidine kinase [Clostridium sp. AL.422]|uniref:sensor histidine kinase n=1 Tax=Clostridium TaxID=1485 RepID=UPI00293DEFC7|nr:MULTISPECIES: HAMP domain-containing sensor histidine kinase [unclassified Clostridium]MDV4150247.1 HAMP domain-containing sensor histidine kinase [Clostridium sp. AL.422]
MKKKSVIYKLLITFSSLIAAFLILIGIVISIWINKEYYNQKYELISNYIEIIKESTTKFINNTDETGYIDLVNTMKIIKISVNMDSIIIDSQGYAYEVSDEDLSYLRYTKIDITDSEMELLKNDTTFEKDFVRDSKIKGRAYYIPMFGKGSFNGAAILIGNESRSYGGIYLKVWIAVLIAIIFSDIIAYYVAKKILINPLSEINNAAKKFAKGEVEKRIYIDSADEIGELAESFNVMAESLETVDTVRREFISNVSHELRSPITSIKGFITAIIDGVIPKDKENYYLNIINDEINRVSRLVTDLLDISSMESGKFKLNIIKIDINEIISLCTLNLEGKIQEKKITVEIIFNQNHEYCFGDRDRIIQVVTNLIENAIKYGDEGGKIQIETYAKIDHVYINIFNTGPNIPKEDANKVWERFYKIDKSRTNKVSTGLGLPIVRLILTQHKQDIWFKNIPDEGVKFTFTLKRASK